MTRINDNFLSLSENYLFSEVAKKIHTYKTAHPDANIIRLGIGDVTLPLSAAVIQALHTAVDEMAAQETFHGYGPEQGYDFLRKAIIENENKEILCALRSPDMSQPNMWEFPGGKIEVGQSPQEALRREIIEELDTEITIGELVDTVEYDYPNFLLSMECFWCEVLSGNLILKEHEDARWLLKEQLDDVEWLPADITLVEKIKKVM